MSPKRDPDRSALAPFAEELRAQRELAGLSRDELAVKLGYSASLVSMIETGHRTPSRDFAVRCDAAFGCPGTFARLEKRLRNVPFSSGFRPFQPYESDAVSLRLFEHTLIPGLLQTEDYAQAVLETHPNTSADVIEERVTARLARQEILAREDPPPPILWVLLDENVLTREVGSSRIMYDQLMHLAEVARRPNVTVQVIPCTVVHPGLLGAFAIAELDGMSPIVYLETGHDGQTIEDPDVGARMSVRFDALRTEALTGRASLSLGYWDSSAGAPQWSPPAIGGSTAITIGIMTALFLLHWSPPVIGGSTRWRGRLRRGGDRAAMEPAGYRREHGTGSGWSPGRRRPQWSPPVIGGSTVYPGAPVTPGVMPQWSPPVVGGSTRPLLARRRTTQGAAMEPAGCRREHPGPVSAVAPVSPPQWSPPVVGGSTGGQVGGVQRHRLAAMEPAGCRREHPFGLGEGTRHERAAMEPAGCRREHPCLLSAQ